MKLFIVAAMLTSFSVLAAPLTMEREGGAGAIIAAEFTTAARQAIRILAAGDETLKATEIFNKIADVEVRAVKDICNTDPITGEVHCVDAYYDGQQTIKFGSESWDKMSCNSKLVVSTHEFLRAAGVEKGDYEYSGRILANTIVRCETNTEEEELECADRAVQIGYLKDQLCDWLKNSRREREL